MKRGKVLETRWAALAVAVAAVLVTNACATTASVPPPPPPPPPRVSTPPPPAVSPPTVRETLPELFESSDFVVTFAKPGDTPATLAKRYLGDASKAWMIEDYTGKQSFAPGEEVVIPREPWNPAGVTPAGYQIVPILCYHNFGPQDKGRLLMAASKFEEQMRYLKAQGYRVVNLREFRQFIEGKRQLPRKAVVLTFDDGYRSFREYAEPILKELGFSATLFVYTDFVGGGRNALSWKDLRELKEAGFDVEAHSKTHSYLTRKQGESDADYAARMRDELALPQRLFRQHLGAPAEAIAYPYGATDDDVLKLTGQNGYLVAFTVRREANSAFVAPLKIHRSQIYSEMSLEDFARNLDVFHEERLK
ncbi:MAG: polysaccharide deacetylase family protein [Candidatus Rokuibacteriota bacterium]